MIPGLGKELMKYAGPSPPRGSGTYLILGLHLNGKGLRFCNFVHTVDSGKSVSHTTQGVPRGLTNFLLETIPHSPLYFFIYFSYINTLICYIR